MKKIIALLIAVIVCCSMMVMPTSAAVPTALTIKETKTAPNVNDKGVIDAAYGSPIFDYRATDLTPGDGDLHPKTQAECAVVNDAISVMRNVGYATYDDKYFYMACVLTDLAPFATSNSAEPWKSTGVQLLLFVNTERSWTTFAYEGTNKVGVYDDNKDRSVLNPDYVTASFYERSKTEYVLEFKIAWEGFPEVESLADVNELKMGVVQTSMASACANNDDGNGNPIYASAPYTCSAFANAYELKYEKALPVTMVSANGNTNNGGSSTVTSTITSTITTPAESDSTNAPSDGTAVDVGGSSDQTVGATESENGDQTTTVVQEGEKDWTMIIILAAVAGVIIIGGAVAIILLNKKPSGYSKE